MDLYVVPSLGVLKPCDATDADKIREMRQGEVYRARIAMPRNIRFHRKFFALLSTVHDNLPHDFALVTPDGQRVEVKTVEDILWHIKMQLGYYEKRVTIGGRVTYEAKSISFAALDEAEFSRFYNEAIDVILKYFLVGANKQDLEDIVIMQFT